MQMTKICSKCGKEKPLASYTKDVRAKGGRTGWCSVCRSEAGKQQRYEARQKVLDHYGRFCSCCGENNELFLTVEHTNGGGRQHRRKIGCSAISIWLVRNNFPSDFTILCYNCNCGKRVNNGICPHKGVYSE